MTKRFDRFAGAAGMLAAAATAVTTLVVLLGLTSNGAGADFLEPLVLAVTALLAVPFFVGLYGQTRATDEGWSLTALLLAAISSLASAAHGAFDVMNLVSQPEEDVFRGLSQTDPAFFFTFAVLAFAVAAFSFVISGTPSLDSRLTPLGYALSISLLFLFVKTAFLPGKGELISQALSSAAGLVLFPAWVGWVAFQLFQGSQVRRGPRSRIRKRMAATRRDR